MARTYEETIYDATVDAVNDALAQPVLPTPDEINKKYVRDVAVSR